MQRIKRTLPTSIALMVMMTLWSGTQVNAEQFNGVTDAQEITAIAVDISITQDSDLGAVASGSNSIAVGKKAVAEGSSAIAVGRSASLGGLHDCTR